MTFFHRSAFDEQPLGVAALLRESAEYARGIGASLRDQVYDALKELAQGFLDYPGNRLATEPASTRAKPPPTPSSPPRRPATRPIRRKVAVIPGSR